MGRSNWLVLTGALSLLMLEPGCAGRLAGRTTQTKLCQHSQPAALARGDDDVTLANATALVHTQAPAPAVADGAVHEAILLKKEPGDQEFLADAASHEVPPIKPMQTSVRLDELIELAMNHNPAIRELAATTHKAAGFRTQVGLRPNPTIGLQSVQLADRGTDQHLIFAEQEFVTGGKLNLNRRVLNEALRAQLLELEAQQIRVRTDIQVAFFEALGLQQQLELITQFKSITDRGSHAATLRLQAGEGSKIDLLQTRIQSSEVELLERQRLAELQVKWNQIMAMAGQSTCAISRLDGALPERAPDGDLQTWCMPLAAYSPEYAAAQVRIQRAVALLSRHCVQPIPNPTLQIAGGYDNGTDSGMINVQAGAPIPVFSKNQGNIAAARAEYCRAVQEAQRIEHAIQARLAEAAGELSKAAAALQLIDGEILASAREALELSEQAYKAGEIDFIQLLVVRRTYFDASLKLVEAQTLLATATARLEGFGLSGALQPVPDYSGDDSLRGLTFSQQ
ncbi:MAG: TolC family protein [Pirellulaceae bacterium]|nr:TolC family protein [Pirellulaceae bacterium]